MGLRFENKIINMYAFMLILCGKKKHFINAKNEMDAK